MDTINANTKTKVLPGWQHQDMKTAVTGAWLAEQFLWAHTVKRHGENQFGCIPQHFILPKNKDIIADCAKVMAKKGQ